MTEATITLVNAKSLLPLFGARDQHIKRIRDAFGVDITHRDGQIRVAGGSVAVANATEALKRMKAMVEQQGTLAEEEVAQVLRQLAGEEQEVQSSPIVALASGRQIRPRTAGQSQYVAAILRSRPDIRRGSFGNGKDLFGRGSGSRSPQSPTHS